jgi:RND family efflux transporter MFP subunit
MFKHAQAAREYEHQRLLLERLRMRAPFAGYVSEVAYEVGETVEEGQAIVTLVSLDPLEVVVDCPLDLASLARVGRQASIAPKGSDAKPRTARIVFANRVIDPASQTFKVKLLVDNEDSAWMAGQKVTVSFRAADSPMADEAVANHAVDSFLDGPAPPQQEESDRVR